MIEAVWNKLTKGRPRIWWDTVVEKVWKDIGRKQAEILSAEMFGKYKAEVKTYIEKRPQPALKNML